LQVARVATAKLAHSIVDLRDKCAPMADLIISNRARTAIHVPVIAWQSQLCVRQRKPGVRPIFLARRQRLADLSQSFVPFKIHTSPSSVARVSISSPLGSRNANATGTLPAVASIAVFANQRFEREGGALWRALATTRLTCQQSARINAIAATKTTFESRNVFGELHRVVRCESTRQ
jgi:hypothetical protein